MTKLLACLLAATALSGAAYGADRALLAQASVEPLLDQDGTVVPAQSPPTGEYSARHKPTKRDVVTLDAAIQEALATSPRLKASRDAELASRGTRRQSSKWVNPEASVGAENVGGRGEYRGLKSGEITYGVSQLFEVGGKRAARVAVADQGVTLAGFDYQAARLDLIRDVQLAYADAATAQEMVTITKEQKALAQQVMDEVSRRVGAAREPLIQESKASVTLSSSIIAYDTALRQLAAAKRTLALLMGEPTDSFRLSTASYYKITKPARLGDTLGALRVNPDLARFDAEMARSRAELDLERANAVPDPRLNAGVRDLRASNDRALVVGVSLPIPVLNRNQGNIERARHDVSRTESLRDSTVKALQADLTRAQAELEASYRQAVVMRDNILPAAKKAFALAREGYNAGKFSYLEVLDAQRTLYSSRAEYQDTLRNYHRSRAEVERLTSEHLQTAKIIEDSNG